MSAPHRSVAAIVWLARARSARLGILRFFYFLPVSFDKRLSDGADLTAHTHMHAARPSVTFQAKEDHEHMLDVVTRVAVSVRLRAFRLGSGPRRGSRVAANAGGGRAGDENARHDTEAAEQTTCYAWYRIRVFSPVRSHTLTQLSQFRRHVTGLHVGSARSQARTATHILELHERPAYTLTTPAPSRPSLGARRSDTSRS